MAAQGLGGLLWLLALSSPAMAADPPVGCGDLPPALTGMVAAWSAAPVPVASGSDATASVGRKLVAQLLSPQELGQTLGRAGQRGAREGLGVVLDLNLTAPGEYRVALSERGWIELAEQGPKGRVLGATTSDKRLACAGIAKNLGFEVLSPGPHRLQITEVPAPQVEILVWPASGMTAGAPQ